MQLRARAAGVALAVLLGAPGLARAEGVELATTHTLWHEAPTRTRMTVYTPAVDATATPWEWLTVRGGWEADVVSGASVSVKAGPAYQATSGAADVISTASVHDFRNVGRGGFTLRKDNVSVTGGYSYGTENDYRSHSFNVAARTETYEHNTVFELSYARNFDSVCDRVQSTGALPVRYRALESSDGCFKASDPLRTTRSVDIDGYQGSWAQSWTPHFVTQLTYTGQILNGFQSNPYRSVVLGQGIKAQEHVPEDRARHAVTMRGNYYLRPLKAALRVGLRGYWDTWSITAGNVDVEAEKYLGEDLRVSLRGRFYKQSGALFWSDDYTGGDPPLGPKGSYFTGDRELSPFWSVSAGTRFVVQLAGADRRVLGVFTSMRLGLGFDFVQFGYEDFTLGGQPLQDTRSYLVSTSLSAAF